MQHYPLLATKLFRPSSNPGLVSRSRLMQQLNANLGPDSTFTRKLTLVSAPAGFGKTTLITEWLDAQKHMNRQCNAAWLSLDEGDSDPARFLHYVVAVMRQLAVLDDSFGEGVLSMLHAPERPPWEIILTPLINAMVNLDQCVMLVLDDLHLVEGQAVHDILTFLIDYMPVRMHLILISREDPPLALSRLRVRRHLTEIRAIDLRFTHTEMVSFIEHIAGLHLSENDLAALEQRTEGWIAGLQLAVLSMQGQQDISTFVQSFTGSHRYVLDYLIEEVLEQQPPEIQRFLVQTSVLDRLCTDLCDAVTGHNNSHTTLAYLEQANLFLISLDNERHWYRYHHLFADLLRERYDRTATEPMTTLHLRASQWFEQNQLMDEAIDHAIKARNTQRALCLADMIADALWKNGQSEKIMQILALLPVQDIYTCPRLTIYRSWYFFINGQIDKAQESIHAVEIAFQLMDSQDSSEVDSIINEGNLTRANLEGRLDAVRTFMESYTGDLEAMATYAQQALASLAETDTSWRGITNLTLGDLYGFQGDMQASYTVRNEALISCKASGDYYFALLAAGKVVISLREQGDLPDTIAFCERELAYADEMGLSQVPMYGMIQVVWGESLFETNQVEQGELRIRSGLTLSEKSVSGLYAGWSYVCKARVSFSKGDLSQVEVWDDKLKQLAAKHNVPPWLSGMMAVWQARVWLVERNYEALNAWVNKRNLRASGLDDATWIPYFALYDYLILARYLLAQGELQAATDLLERLVELTEGGGRFASIIEIKLLQALVFQKSGKQNSAFTALENVLSLAKPRKFVRVFVDEGPATAKLLYDAQTRTNHPAYTQELLAAFSDASEQVVAPAQETGTVSPVVEPLSDREIEVLQLISDGLTNPEIAKRLYVSLNTVKAHTRNIYGKLGVNNRTQAANRAKVLGLVK